MRIEIELTDEQALLVLPVLLETCATQHRLADNYPLRSQDPDTERYVVKGTWSAVRAQLRAQQEWPATLAWGRGNVASALDSLEATLPALDAGPTDRWLRRIAFAGGENGRRAQGIIDRLENRA